MIADRCDSSGVSKQRRIVCIQLAKLNVQKCYTMPFGQLEESHVEESGEREGDEETVWNFTTIFSSANVLFDQSSTSISKLPTYMHSSLSSLKYFDVFTRCASLFLNSSMSFTAFLHPS